MDRVTFDDIRIDPVLDATGRFPPTLSFKNSTDEQWSVHQDLLDDEGLLNFAMGGFLIRNGRDTVLVDAGVGPGKRVMGMTGGQMLDSLAALGVSPAEITDVMFTHLHTDHVGWAELDDGRPVFDNAVYRCALADWEHFVAAPGGAQTDKLGPLAERFEFWTGAATLKRGIDVQPAPGHTPGSTIMVISSGAGRALLIGDVVHCPIQLVDDEWDGLFDVDPELARQTRNALAREMEGADVPIAAAHFGGLHFGRLLPGQSRRRWLV